MALSAPLPVDKFYEGYIAIFSEERVDLFKYSPVCLPIESDNFEQSEAYIYGGFGTFSLLVICFCSFCT